MSAPVSPATHLLHWERLSDEAFVAKDNGATWRIRIGEGGRIGYLIVSLPRSNGRTVDDVVQHELLDDCGGRVDILVLRLKMWADTYADRAGIKVVTAWVVGTKAQQKRKLRRRRRGR